ncbi:hypothetical protein [Runella slithyformis]|uniref:Uncharacterized protein n=1 Tax=Runella slithyformis (strain ATCC 29530 / DSM 19594 / LMG 11500 / NCIMB 11436 / LSU 4) TaxID=761193 RepID=A0A7U3ZGI3_RUNSL|nr:hypothetical protein [Runella slithyformis]AEI46785.1 hypothetical protein Runsl_0333 [Runella slithyformis DSM 19594]
METQIKAQIEKEIAKCNRRIYWSTHPQPYWIERRAILMNSLHYGFKTALGDIEKTLSKSPQYSAEIVKANQDTLSDIQTKWA